MFKKCLYLRTDICGIQFTAGGSVGHTLGVIKELQKRYEVYVFSSQMKQILQKEKIKFVFFKNIKIFFMSDKIPLLWRWYYVRWRLECIFSTLFFFIQIILKTRKQVFAFVYQRNSILNGTGLLVSWYKKIPFILEYNGSEAYWFSPAATDPWYMRWFAFKKLSYWIEDLNLYYATTVVAVSQALKDELVIRGVQAEKIVVNPNGVEEEIFYGARYMQQKEALRLQYSLEDKFVFGFIGTFGHWHGIEMLARIIPQICDQYPSVVFFLIGDGSLRLFLEAEVATYIQRGQVVLTGAIAQHKAPEYLSLCDAFLCPTRPNADGTRFFGSPTKLFEYMSMAKPVIASDLEQLAQVVNPAVRVNVVSNISTLQHVTITDQVGLLVPPLDEQGFVKACQLCLSLSDQQRKKIGQNARNEVLEKYTWKKHVERILERL